MESHRYKGMRDEHRLDKNRFERVEDVIDTMWTKVGFIYTM
jgi:hypothetical protein